VLQLIYRITDTIYTQISHKIQLLNHTYFNMLNNNKYEHGQGADAICGNPGSHYSTEYHKHHNVKTKHFLWLNTKLLSILTVQKSSKGCFWNFWNYIA